MLFPSYPQSSTHHVFVSPILQMLCKMHCTCSPMPDLHASQIPRHSKTPHHFGIQLRLSAKPNNRPDLAQLCQRLTHTLMYLLTCKLVPCRIEALQRKCKQVSYLEWSKCVYVYVCIGTLYSIIWGVLIALISYQSLHPTLCVHFCKYVPHSTNGYAPKTNYTSAWFLKIEPNTTCEYNPNGGPVSTM